MTDQDQPNKTTTLQNVVDQLPKELHEVAYLVRNTLNVPGFYLNSVTMTKGEDGSDITGLEITALNPVPGNHGVVVFSIDNEWFIAALNSDKSSKGGWSRPKETTTPQHVVKMVEKALSEPHPDHLSLLE